MTPLDRVFNVQDFGAVGDFDPSNVAGPYTLNHKFFQAALDAIAARSSHETNGTIDLPGGAILYIPPGQYYIEDTLHITRSIVIQGAGGRAIDSACSVLRFDPTTDGIIVHCQATAPPEPGSLPSPGARGTGYGTVVRDIAVAGIPTSIGSAQDYRSLSSYNEDDPSSAPALNTNHAPVHGHGIILYSQASIENCVVRYFAIDGVQVDTIEDGSNANGWQIRNCYLGDNGRHGLYVAGVNSNAGTVVGVTAQGNWGWGFYDRSHFGGTYIGCIAEKNGHQITEITALLVDATSPYSVFAGTARDGLYRSIDQGHTWTEANLSLHLDYRDPATNLSDGVHVDGASNLRVQALAIDPTRHRGTWYVGAAGGYREFPDASPALHKGAVFQSNELLAHHFGSTALETQSTLFGSDQNGLTTPDVRALVVDQRTTPGDVYAGTAGGGVFRGVASVSGELNPNPMVNGTWAPFNTNLADLQVRALAISSPGTNASAALFAGTQSGVFSSPLGTDNWTARGPAVKVNSLAVLRYPVGGAGLTIVAGTDDGVFWSLDAGVSWLGRDLLGIVVNALAADPFTGRIFAGTASGIWLSATPGTPFSLTQATNGDPVQAIALQSTVNPEPAPAIYAATKSASLWLSRDAGDTWAKSTPDGLTNIPYYGGPYRVRGNTNNSVLLSCYTEGKGRNDAQQFGSEIVAPNALVLGGTGQGEFRFTTTAGLIVATPNAAASGMVRLSVLGPVLESMRTIDSADVPSAVMNANDGVVFLNAEVGDLTVRLPDIEAGVVGRQYVLKRIDSLLTKPHVVTITSHQPIGEVITSLTLDPNSALTLIADANRHWQVIGKL